MIFARLEIFFRFTISEHCTVANFIHNTNTVNFFLFHFRFWGWSRAPTLGNWISLRYFTFLSGGCVADASHEYMPVSPSANISTTSEREREREKCWQTADRSRWVWWYLTCRQRNVTWTLIYWSLCSLHIKRVRKRRDALSRWPKRCFVEIIGISSNNFFFSYNMHRTAAVCVAR